MVRLESRLRVACAFPTLSSLGIVELVSRGVPVVCNRVEAQHVAARALALIVDDDGLLVMGSEVFEAPMLDAAQPLGACFTVQAGHHVVMDTAARAQRHAWVVPCHHALVPVRIEHLSAVARGRRWREQQARFAALVERFGLVARHVIHGGAANEVVPHQ
ncbi:hypothetical protein D3C86_1667330 [compost metagenome]